MPFQSAQAGCEKPPRPYVKVNKRQKEVRYERTHSSSLLTRMKGYPAGSDDNRVFGLGGGDVAVDLKYRFISSNFAAQNCTHLEYIHADLTLHPVIHIASDFPQGSCEYAAVMDHEYKHIRLLERHYNDMSHLLQIFLNDLAKEINARLQTRNEPMSESYEEQLAAYIQEKLGGFTDAQSTKHQALQKEIDSVDEYDRVTRLCTGWFKADQAPPE